MEELEIYTKGKPHLIILGAGASVATIPYGDANGTEDLKKIKTFEDLELFYEPILKDEELEKEMCTNFWL